MNEISGRGGKTTARCNAGRLYMDEISGRKGKVAPMCEAVRYEKVVRIGDREEIYSKDIKSGEWLMVHKEIVTEKTGIETSE